MKKTISLAVFVLLFSIAPFVSPCQEAGSAPAPLTQGPSDPKELEAFIDGIMAAHLEANHIVGATISVVKDGQLFFAKGYGYANIKSKTPVLPDRTMFRPGSVSKLFTWTAVMQLYEQGKLDLNADVNTYLKEFQIPATFPQPITLNHLLSHTPGFEERSTGMAAREAKDLTPLGKWLASHMPARVRPPGELTSYSNYGTSLAGYIIEVVSGVPFEQYIEENIFKPLGIERSTFRQPLPEALAPDMSTGYTYKNGAFKEEKFELLNGMAPAGSLSACATDMARFMIAHLQNGAYGDARILKEETAKLMHSRLFGHDPRVNGNAHGFWEFGYNDLRLIEHGGDTVYFHSQLALIPDKNVGWFVSYNTSPGGSREQLFHAFLNRYYPASSPLADLKPSPDALKRLKKVSGVYRMTRISHTKYEKIAALLMQIKVAPTKEGTLLVKVPGDIRQYVELEPLVFREVDGQGKVVFKEDDHGRVAIAFAGDVPHMALLKLKWYEHPMFHYVIIGFCVLFFFIAAIGWPLAALSRKICRRKVEGHPAPKAARWLAGLMSACFFVFLILTAASFSSIYEVMFGVPRLFKIALAFPVIAAVLAIGVLAFTLLAWGKKYWYGCRRLTYTMILMSAVVFLWVLSFYNLLGWRL
ncbi:MAG: serine hydrolase domain-containing protein [Clostridiales bacterium]|nr:serine hydrolase domain-containing protein [Clostridiales bacterium]